MMQRRDFLKGLPLLGVATPQQGAEELQVNPPMPYWRVKVNEIVLVVQMGTENISKLRDYASFCFWITPLNGPMKCFPFETVAGLREIDASVRWIGLIAALEPIDGIRWQSRYVDNNDLKNARIEWDYEWDYVKGGKK